MVDGVRLANFVLPLYFLEGGHKTERVDFLGSPELQSFGVKAEGYIPYFNPETGQEEEYPQSAHPQLHPGPTSVRRPKNHRHPAMRTP